jgi:two-component system sensor histidine kinase GlrK
MERLPIIKIDRERILQALRNIMGNAIKFSPEGGRVKISVRSVDHGVEVSVADAGPGIPAEDLTTIFEKFKQTTIGGLPPNQGTGLGLAIAKQIITYHGGKIWAESEPGQGSTFIFVLPA